MRLAWWRGERTRGQRLFRWRLQHTFIMAVLTLWGMAFLNVMAIVLGIPDFVGKFFMWGFGVFMTVWGIAMWRFIQLPKNQEDR